MIVYLQLQGNQGLVEDRNKQIKTFRIKIKTIMLTSLEGCGPMLRALCIPLGSLNNNHRDTKDDA